MADETKACDLHSAVNRSFIHRIFAANNVYFRRNITVRPWQRTFTNTPTGQILPGRINPSMPFLEKCD